MLFYYISISPDYLLSILQLNEVSTKFNLHFCCTGFIQFCPPRAGEKMRRGGVKVDVVSSKQWLLWLKKLPLRNYNLCLLTRRHGTAQRGGGLKDTANTIKGFPKLFRSTTVGCLIRNSFQWLFMEFGEQESAMIALLQHIISFLGYCHKWESKLW